MPETFRNDPRPHVVVINRWREHYARYAEYLDHGTHRVTYISTTVGLGSVPGTATDVELVEKTDDLDQARAALAALVGRNGPVHRIVALKEDDLLVGARLRAEHDVPGDRPEDLIRFRDKGLMCRAVEAAGLPVPPFVEVDGPESVLATADRLGWPLVLKPRVGTCSAGVVLLSGPQDLADQLPLTEPMLVQAFDPNPIHHVDGLFDGTGLVRWRVSRYVNTCLGFRESVFLGSVEEDDPEVVAAVGAATTGYLGALTDAPVPFHLELFVDRGPDGVSCSFLEVGARVGGAEIPFIWRDLHGWDLMGVAFALQIGAVPPEPAPATDEVGGWLLIPAPAERPCVITEATPMTGRLPGPYAEAVLSPGEVLPAADAFYEHVGGRFRFRGGSTEEVESALVATAAAFRVRAEALTTREREMAR